ncbi:MAG TPA: hypothetical protein VGI71_09645 [Scandinavium sp.]|jgi:hypothetical protein
MVIKVDSKGLAKVAKWELRQIACDAGFRLGNAADYREARKGGMRYYRRNCIFDELYGHGQYEGMFYDARADPPQILMPCRCCYAEWLFYSEDVKEAIAAIKQNKRAL